MQLPSREDWQESLISKEHEVSTYVDVSVTPTGMGIGIFFGTT